MARAWLLTHGLREARSCPAPPAVKPQRFLLALFSAESDGTASTGFW